MNTIYEELEIQMSENGWTNQRNVVSPEYTKSVWKKKGDIGEWQMLMEHDVRVRKDEVFCVMEMKAGKKFGAKLYTPLKVLGGVGVNPILETLRKGIEKLVEKETKGGYICKNL